MKFFRTFKVNGEDREFMHLYGAETKQELLDFLDEFRQHFNKGDLYKITHNRQGTYFILWDARA